jgi:hypothetical protein
MRAAFTYWAVASNERPPIFDECADDLGSQPHSVRLRLRCAYLSHCASATRREITVTMVALKQEQEVGCSILGPGLQVVRQMVRLVYQLTRLELL